VVGEGELEDQYSFARREFDDDSRTLADLLALIHDCGSVPPACQPDICGSKQR
jgi:hypothetical protein